MDIKVYITSMRTKVTEKFHYTWFLEKFWEKRIFNNIDEAIQRIIKKYGKDTDVEVLLDYKKDKNKTPELNKKVIKKIDNI
jgi:hypothetical protein